MSAPTGWANRDVWYFSANGGSSAYQFQNNDYFHASFQVTLTGSGTPGIDLEAVGIDDAARAMILAAERGRVGERYLISEKMINNAEVARIAANEAGVAPPAKTIPLPMSYALATIGTLKARLRRTDERLSLGSLRLMRAEGPLDHGKAVDELGWQPRPVEESIREAARFWVGLRAAKKQAKAASE